MKKSIDAAKGCVTFTFDDGVAPASLYWADVSPENQAYAGLFGFGHRLGDNAAISRTAENNYRVTEEKRRAAVVEMIEHYRSGTTEWNLRTARAPTQNLAVAALATQRGVSYNEALAQLAHSALNELANLKPPTPERTVALVYQALALPAPV